MLRIWIIFVQFSPFASVPPFFCVSSSLSLHRFSSLLAPVTLTPLFPVFPSFDSHYRSCRPEYALFVDSVQEANGYPFGILIVES